MKGIPEEIKFLILKWRQGRVSEEEKLTLNAWYNEQLPNELVWTGDDERQLKDRLYAKIGKEIDLAEPVYKKRLGSYNWLKGAAAAVLLLMVAVFVYQYLSPEPARLTEQVVKVDDGIRKIILPDSSIVWLKGDSHLRYPKRFGTDVREVELSGEALFEVVSNNRQPFVIRSGDYTTKVLGTSFNLKVNRENGDFDLTVLTGKVQVAKKTSKLREEVFIVQAAETFRSTTEKVEDLKANVPIESLAHFSQGTEYNMNFVRTPFETIMDHFEKKFDVRFEGYTGEYTSCNITANLTDQSLEKSLKILSMAINADYKISDNVIYLTGGGCL